MKNRVTLDSVYDQIPEVRCKGLCQEACGPIAMTGAEWRRIVAARGGVPPVATSLTCPLLDANGRCSVYPVRPFICRVYGAAQELPCPHGCGERLLSLVEVARLHHALEATAHGKEVVALAPTWHLLRRALPERMP